MLENPITVIYINILFIQWIHLTMEIVANT